MNHATFYEVWSQLLCYWAQFKRLLLRFERIQQRHYGMKLLAYTLINLRKFCGI